MFSAVIFTGCGSGTPDEPQSEIENPNPDQPQGVLPVPGLSFNTVTLSNEGDTFACIIHGLADNNWDAKCEQPWCYVSTTGNVLKITVTQNTSPNIRTATISILHSDKRVMGNITVNQCSLPKNTASGYSTTLKHSFFPMFTATWCPYCPEMDWALDKIQEQWDYPILPMRIHVKGSELYNPLSDELSDLYNNNTAPTGYFENYFRVENMCAAYLWDLILSKTSDCNDYTSSCSSIRCQTSLSDDTINAEISIEPIKNGEYRLLVFILEDNIIKPQESATNGEIYNYCHNGVLVGALTSVKGQELGLTSSPKIISLTGLIPSNVNLPNLRLLVVLERNTANLNFSDECWYADNCLSVPLGKSADTGMIENIYVGDEIEN